MQNGVTPSSSACGPLGVTQHHELAAERACDAGEAPMDPEEGLAVVRLPSLGIYGICYKPVRRGCSCTTRHPSLEHWWDPRPKCDHTIITSTQSSPAHNHHQHKPETIFQSSFTVVFHCTCVVLVITFAVCMFWFFSVGNHVSTVCGVIIFYIRFCKLSNKLLKRATR